MSDVKVCGLLGRKLSHSYSPMIHVAFDAGYSYDLFEIEPDELAGFFGRQGDGERQRGGSSVSMILRDRRTVPLSPPCPPTFHGLNVTIPYKKEVMQFCTEISPIAQAIGSVNTILRLSDGGLFGDNTDGQGFLAMLLQSGINIAGKKVLVLGSGGSSLTVSYILKQQSAHEIVVVSRNGENNYKALSMVTIDNNGKLYIQPKYGKFKTGQHGLARGITW